MNKLLYITFILACTLPTLTAAQSLQNLGGQGTALNVTTIPARPAPNQSVRVYIESYSVDLDRSYITWFLNNAVAQEATGKKSFSFKTGGAGSASDIRIVVKTADGSLLQQTLTIRPATVDLIWEAQSYTPPFYRGKAFYPPQGVVKIVAMPEMFTENGGVISAKNIVYTWKVGDDVMPDASGYGKNVFLFRGGTLINPALIEVEASSVDKSSVAAGSLRLDPQSPQLLFYEDSPLYGVLYNKALQGTVALQNEELKLSAVPYFMGVQGRSGTGLSYQWLLNNESAGISNSKDSLSFREEKGSAGSALVSLQVSNPSKLFQFANNSLSLIFGGEKTAASF